MSTSRFVNIIYVTILLVFLQSNVVAAQLEKLWQLNEFDAPESVLYDSEHRVIFLSNVHGKPDDRDAKGYISVISLDGRLLNKYWITGLDAPKGLARDGDILYVSDLDALIAIDINSGKILNRYMAAQARFLNDVVVNNNGDVYVSDMMTNTIYRLSKNRFSSWLHSDLLESPNGLYIKQEQLIVASWGDMTDGFNTDIPGHLKSVSIDSRKVRSLGSGTPVGNLDGIDVAGQNEFYVTDWLNGGLFMISDTGEAKKVLPLPPGSADLDVVPEESLVLIPAMIENYLTAYRIVNQQDI